MSALSETRAVLVPEFKMLACVHSYEAKKKVADKNHQSCNFQKTITQSTQFLNAAFFLVKTLSEQR